MIKKPVISIIIPTYIKSAATLEIPLKSIINQRCSKELYEVIIVDNHGGDMIKRIGRNYKTRFIEVNGNPSQLCRQINEGVKVASGDYVLIQDHDIGMDKDLIRNFTARIRKDKKDVDAWYIPYKIVARGNLLTRIRNFEEGFYNNSVIAAPRLFKKSLFLKAQWDPKVSAGAPDWDFTIQIMLKGAKFGYLKNYFHHHEEQMSLWEFISKKTIYSNGGEIYKNKWRKKNPEIYNSIVVKQYDPFYRLFTIFVRDGQWKSLLPNLHLYTFFLGIKITMAVIYIFNQKVKKRLF